MSEKALHPDMRAIMQVSEKITEQMGPRGGKPEEDRQWWTLYTEALSQPYPEEMEVFDLAIPTEESDVPVHVYRSESEIDPRSVIVYMHGSGFMRARFSGPGARAEHDAIRSYLQEHLG